MNTEQKPEGEGVYLCWWNSSVKLLQRLLQSTHVIKVSETCVFQPKPEKQRNWRNTIKVVGELNILYQSQFLKYKNKKYM